MWWKKRITTLTCPFLQFSLQTMKDEKQNNNYWKKWKGTNRNFGYKWPEKQSLTCVGWGSIWAPFPIPCPDAPPNTDCLLDSLPFYSFLHLQKIRKSAICRQLLYMFCCRKKNGAVSAPKDYPHNNNYSSSNNKFSTFPVDAWWANKKEADD